MTTNILFINPPSMPYNQVERVLKDPDIFINQAVSMPMGILYLAAVLEAEDHDVNIEILDYAKIFRDYGVHEDRVSLDFHHFSQMVLEQVPEGFVPDVIGISILFSTAHKTAGAIAKTCAERWPDAAVIAGGMHATNAVNELLEFPGITYVCRGEAESIITDVVKKVAANDDVEQIAGIFGRTKAQKPELVSSEVAPFINDLDEIPYPAWHLIPVAEYTQARGRSKNLGQIDQSYMGTIVTTRGCPFRCTFCASWTVHGRKMRFRSIPNVLEELRILYEDYGVNFVVPEDDLFTVKKSRIIELCDAITAEFKGKINFQFPNGLSVATLDEDVIDALVRMDMHVVSIAIESGSNYVQRNIIKKNCDLERAQRVVQYCSDIGLVVRCYWVVGFPGETREMIDETFDFAASLPSDWDAFGIAAPLVGTEMYQQLLDRNDIDETYNWDNAFFQTRSFDTDEISAEEIKDITYAANIRINFLNNKNLRNGNHERAVEIFSDILADYPDHFIAHYCIMLAKTNMGDEAGAAESRENCLSLLQQGGMSHQHVKMFPEVLDTLKIGAEDLPEELREAIYGEPSKLSA